jgi:hypothetical protein
MDLTFKQIASLNTRLVASESLLKALTYLLKNKERISEVSLCNKWLEEMRKNNNIFSDGWYNPPPHGLSVLFGTDNNFDRISPSTLRPPESWPRSDIFLNRKNGIISVYASPVNQKTGMIGDFGLTLYFGTNQQIKNHLKTCLSIDKKVFEYSQVGMQLSEIYNYTQKLFLVEGLKIILLVQQTRQKQILGILFLPLMKIGATMKSNFSKQILIGKLFVMQSVKEESLLIQLNS